MVQCNLLFHSDTPQGFLLHPSRKYALFRQIQHFITSFNATCFDRKPTKS